MITIRAAAEDGRIVHSLSVVVDGETAAWTDKIDSAIKFLRKYKDMPASITIDVSGNDLSTRALKALKKL